MADILSLAAARKARDRAAAKARADANRRSHGRTKAEKAADAGDAARRDALLDGARRETEEPA